MHGFIVFTTFVEFDLVLQQYWMLSCGSLNDPSILSGQSISSTNEFIEHIYESNNGNGTVYNIHQQWNTKHAQGEDVHRVEEKNLFA